MHLQEILARELARFGEHGLNIVETGTLRIDSEASRIGDGWSTVYFAERLKKHGGRFFSIDLDVSVARRVLTDRGLSSCCDLVEDHSIATLSKMCRDLGAVFDVVFLDSDNDGQLIFHEYLIAKTLLRSGGLVIVDDVRMAHHVSGEASLAKKGSVLLPELLRSKTPHRLYERGGWNGYRTGVLAVDCP